MINYINCFDSELKNEKIVLVGDCENYIYKNNINSEEIFEYLLNNKKKYNFGFRIDLDVNFWVKDLEIDKIKCIFDSKEVKFKEYTIKYYRNKFFDLKKGGERITIYDAYGFFNCSFLNAIDKIKINLSSEEKKILDEGKKLRAKNFGEMTKEEIIKYNKTECEILRKIMIKLIDLLKNTIYEKSEGGHDNFFVTNLYGASAITTKFLMNYCFDLYSENYDFFNSEIKEMIEKSYYGGRAETFKVGTFKNVYKYDINSAYPSLINELRIINDIEIKKYNNEKIKKENIYSVSFNIKDNFLVGLLPVRGKSGMLFFPSSGSGYYTGYELEQVIEYSKKFNIDVTIDKYLEVSLGEKIFNNNVIKKIYNERKKYKQTNDLKEYIYKIFLNSLYGKLAQKVGFNKFRHYYYATLITSYCRAMLLKYSINNVNDIIFYATDCIVSKKEIKNITISGNLGDWSHEKFDKIVVLLSGVYFTFKNNKIKSSIRSYLNLEYKDVIKDISKKGFTIVKEVRFITWKYGLKNYKKFSKYILKFITLEKKLDVYNSQIKRKFDFNIKNIKNEYNSELIELNKINFKENIINDIKDVEELIDLYC